MKSMEEFVEEVGVDCLVTVKGGGTRWEVGGSLLDGTKEVAAPIGIVNVQPEEMIVKVGAGTKLDVLMEELSNFNQEVTLSGLKESTVGGCLAVGSSSHRRARIGAASDVLLQADCVGADGKKFTAGGPTVKNVTGYDICKLLVSSLGTLALLGIVTLRTRPKPEKQTWLSGMVGFNEITARCYRPASVLSDGVKTFVLLEGYAEDIDKEASSLNEIGMLEMEKGPEIPPALKGNYKNTSGEGLLDLQTGVLHSHNNQKRIEVSEKVRELSSRVKDNFDPTGRLNPGRSPYFS